jgi:hypothetical protein
MGSNPSVFKGILLMGLTAILAGSSALAAKPETHYMQDATVVDLTKGGSVVKFAISYPGPTLSGLCGMEIRTSHFGGEKIQELLAAIEVKNDLGTEPVVSVKNGRTIEIDLTAASGSYGTWFSIRTRNRKPLGKLIKEILGDDVVAHAIATTCR